MHKPNPFRVFQKQISGQLQLTREEFEWLQENIEVREYPSQETFFREGTVSRTIWFVVKGMVRLFYHSKGRDRTAFFYGPGKFICAGASFTFGVPARENYETLGATTLLHFEQEAIGRVLERFPRLEVLARLATEDELITCQQMIAGFVTLSPEERYLELLERDPELLQKVPQQYVASFLGVSPETLSRIRKRVAEKMLKNDS